MGLLSERVARARLTASAAAAQRARELRAAGIDIIALAQDEPDFDTPEHVIEAAYRAMRAGQTHYTPVDGTPSSASSRRRVMRSATAISQRRSRS